MKSQMKTSDFSLVVDDFGVKYAGKEHIEHLIACIQNIIQYQ